MIPKLKCLIFGHDFERADYIKYQTFATCLGRTAGQWYKTKHFCKRCKRYKKFIKQQLKKITTFDDQGNYVRHYTEWDE